MCRVVNTIASGASNLQGRFRSCALDNLSTFCCLHCPSCHVLRSPHNLTFAAYTTLTITQSDDTPPSLGMYFPVARARRRPLAPSITRHKEGRSAAGTSSRAVCFVLYVRCATTKSREEARKHILLSLISHSQPITFSAGRRVTYAR